MPPIDFIAQLLVILVLSLTVHEFAHAKIADLAGDPTPGIYGRVTLNPIKHLDPVGSLFMLISMFAGIGIGWARPVPMDPRKMRNPRWDHFSAVIGGPLSNLVIAVFMTVLYKLVHVQGMGGTASLGNFLFLAIVVNVALFSFNLIPLGPLDGMWILGTFLPERIRWRWTKWNLTYGQFAFLALVLIQGSDGLPLIANFYLPLREFVMRFLLGG